MESTREQTMEKCHEFLEIQMQNFSRKMPLSQRKTYLTGCIETLSYFQSIDNEITEELLLLYGI